MKSICTSMLLLLSVALFATPHGTNPVEDKGKKATNTSVPSTPASNPAMVTMQQLQEENASLKARLDAYEKQMENEKSMLQYRYTMVNMINLLENNGRMDKLEDLKSQVNFTRVMGNTLLLINNQYGR